jgi:hypothetical protein
MCLFCCAAPRARLTLRARALRDGGPRREQSAAEVRPDMKPARLSEASVRPLRVFITLLLLGLPAGAPRAQTPAAAPRTDLDDFMARALERRDIDRKTLSDYVLDEVESFELLGPGRVPVSRMRREYTWYVRDGVHVRSPVRFDGVPIPESDRRAYEDKWMKSELARRQQRAERDAKRAREHQGPPVSGPSLNEPRFVSESYFMDFRFEPGNYYLAGRESLDGHQVLKIDYLPTKLFDEDQTEANSANGAKDPKAQNKHRERDDDIDRKMEKTSQVTLWVDPETHQIVKYTFDNVWLDFLPAGWLVKIDDIRASMQMGQPFPGVWLPHDLAIHAGVTVALGSMEVQYRREFSNYRKADVTSKVKVPKGDPE